ncbi:MAG TPA: 50S ribosomal protein L17 [Thermoanaerobaculia bacterium]|jgi:large subunit ribosomal protein L17
MRHRKLGRTSSHREALFRNQLQSLVDHEKIVTTLPKAKELRPIAEKLITRGKHGTLHDRRWVLRWVLSRDLVKKVFDEIAPRFHERPGGYLRIVKLGPRQGDGAEMAVLELVERAAAEAAEPVKESKAPKAKGGSPKLEKPNKKVDDGAVKSDKPKREAKAAPKKVAKGEGAKKPSTQKASKAQTSTPKKSV